MLNDSAKKFLRVSVLSDKCLKTAVVNRAWASGYVTLNYNDSHVKTKLDSNISTI